MDIFGWTKGQFSLFDLLSVLLKKVGPASVWVTTWTAGDADLKDAYNFIEQGLITDFKLLIDRSFETRQGSYVRTVAQTFGEDSVRIARLHAKVALIKAGDIHLCIRTSMNLNSNPRWEQFEVTDDKEMFEFLKEMWDSVWETDAHFGCSETKVLEATVRPFENKPRGVY